MEVSILLPATFHKTSILTNQDVIFQKRVQCNIEQGIHFLQLQCADPTIDSPDQLVVAENAAISTLWSTLASYTYSTVRVSSYTLRHTHDAPGDVRRSPIVAQYYEELGKSLRQWLEQNGVAGVPQEEIAELWIKWAMGIIAPALNQLITDRPGDIHVLIDLLVMCMLEHNRISQNKKNAPLYQELLSNFIAILHSFYSDIDVYADQLSRFCASDLWRIHGIDMDVGFISLFWSDSIKKFKLAKHPNAVKLRQPFEPQESVQYQAMGDNMVID
jgi:hypothetical protein